MHPIRYLAVAEIRQNLQKELGSRIRAARQRRGLSQSKLAYLAGLHVSHLSKIERGRTNVTMASLLAISLALEIDPSEPLRSLPFPDLLQTLPQAQAGDEPKTTKPTLPVKDLRHGA